MISATEVVIRLLTCTFGRVARDRYREEWLADANASSEIGIGRLSVLAGATHFAFFSSASLLGGNLMVNTRRNVRRTLAYGFGIALLLTLAGAVFPPALVLAVLGSFGVVVIAAVFMARGTSRWSYVWVAAVSGVLWIAAIITYWTLWATAFNFADTNRTIPAAIQFGSTAALVAGVSAFAALTGTAFIIQLRSGKLPKVEADPSA
jgi:hypothetical protein